MKALQRNSHLTFLIVLAQWPLYLVFFVLLMAVLGEFDLLSFQKLCVYMHLRQNGKETVL